MPTVTYALPQDNIVYARCIGHIVPADIIGWNIDKQFDLRKTAQILVVIDLSEVTGTDMSFSDMNAIHGKLSRHYEATGHCLQLVLYAPDDLAFGMSRILESLSAMSSSVNVEVYRSKASMENRLPQMSMNFSALQRSLYESQPNSNI